ncbi:MAG TPA: hypothetical protein VGV88_09490 [Candidatus Dormibacteraeota bacterium]|nr:hypothetical protein [Candidatus Dormibacteraeota bacterium]
MSGEQAGGLAMGLFACLLGAGGIYAAIRRRARRAEIAATYGSTGGIAFTVVQAGCSGVLLAGGLGLILVALLLKG